MKQAANFSALLLDRSPLENIIVQDVTKYLLRVPSIIMDVSQSVLRDVNLRGYKGFTTVSEKSAERYARNFARIIISANRVQRCTFFPAFIHPFIATYLASIQDCSADRSKRLLLLHDLLCSISFQTLDNIDSPRSLFLFQFITFASVFNKFRNPSNSFRFGDASDFSPLLAALLYDVTSCALTEVYSLGLQARNLSKNSPPNSLQKHPADPCDPSPAHQSPLSSPDPLPSPPTKKHLNDRLEHVLSCFDESKNSAPSTIRRLLTTAHEINKADDVRFTFDSCQEHHLCGIVRNVHIKMKDLGNIVKSLHRDVQSLLSELTYGASLPDKFLSNVAAFKDSIQNKSVGYSFLVHPDNIPHVREYTLWLFQQLTANKQTAKAVFNPSPSTPSDQVITVLGATLRRDAVQGCLAKSKTLQEKLLACIHISSGSPGRATELETLCLFNTTSHLRNLYISQGRVLLVTRYVKQRWLTGTDKIIPRFPDPETSKFLLTYLVLIRTIEAQFIEKLFGQDQSTVQMTSLFTERGTPFSAARIRDVITSTFDAHSLHILFNDLRHYSAGIIPTVTKNSPNLIREQLMADARAVAHLQAGHSPGTAEANFRPGEQMMFLPFPFPL